MRPNKLHPNIPQPGDDCLYTIVRPRQSEIIKEIREDYFSLRIKETREKYNNVSYYKLRQVFGKKGCGYNTEVATAARWGGEKKVFSCSWSIPRYMRHRLKTRGVLPSTLEKYKAKG